MNLKSVDLNLLVVFDAIFTEGSLSRAADRVAMSQPATSNALARLRVAMDDPLFTRRGYGMEPTVRARQIAKPIRQALDVLQAGLSTNAEFDFRTARESFSIATEDFGDVVILPRLMNWLSKVAPMITVKVASERAGAALMETRRGSIDIALDYIPAEHSQLVVQHLMREERVCVMRNDHPRIAEAITLDTYLSLPHLVLNRKLAGGAVVTQELARRSLTRNVAMEVPHYLSMPAVLLQTDYISTMPRRVAQVVAEHFRLKIVRLPLELPDMSIYMSWNGARTSDPSHRWFRESIKLLCDRL